jgi:precorrin-3B methylase
MFTTVFIGSSNTLADHGRMITPRGYERKQLR